MKELSESFPIGNKKWLQKIRFTSFCYPLMTEVLKFEYVNEENFKYGTTVEWVKKLSQS